MSGLPARPSAIGTKRLLVSSPKRRLFSPAAVELRQSGMLRRAKGPRWPWVWPCRGAGRSSDDVQQLNLQADDRNLFSAGESRLRLQTIVRLRWFAVLGQLFAISFVYFGLGFDLPVGYCLGLIA